MGSFKRPERSDKARRVRHARVNRVQPVRLPGMEPLEARRMLDVGIGYNTITQPPNWHATNNNISDLTNGPLANAGQTLESIYQGYEAFAVGAGPGATYNSPLSSQIEFQGNYVGVRVNTWGDFNRRRPPFRTSACRSPARIRLTASSRVICRSASC